MIQIQDVLSRIESLAKKYRWTLEHISCSKMSVPVLKRSGDPAAKNVYISAGIHGDEPAGPLALFCLIEKDEWPENHNLWIIPCLNPEGFTCNRRENEEGIDLNRDYLKADTPEVAAHIAWLEKQPDFDLSICLHEDWEAAGFYLYELRGEQRPSLAASLIRTVSAVFPIETAKRIDSFPAQNGVIYANDLPMRIQDGWPEAFWLFKKKGGLNYTLETASDFDLAARAEALAQGIKTALRLL